MLGLGDPKIAAALIGCIGITLFAVIYGALNWNRGSDPRKEVARIRCRRVKQDRRRNGGKGEA